MRGTAAETGVIRPQGCNGSRATSADFARRQLRRRRRKPLTDFVGQLVRHCGVLAAGARERFRETRAGERWREQAGGKRLPLNRLAPFSLISAPIPCRARGGRGAENAQKTARGCSP